MVKKIFTSSSNYEAHGALKIGNPLNSMGGKSNTEISIAFFKSETEKFPESFIFLDKSTAISFVNELKREIAKLSNDPF